MLDIATLKIGQKVHYQPKHYKEDQWENGMIKEIPDHTNNAIRVVFHCNGDWNKFQDYTSQLTNLNDLKSGWRH
jgi:hypothetical protein